jgi:hypothetical protein
MFVKTMKLLKILKLVMMSLRRAGRAKVSLRLSKRFGQPYATWNWGQPFTA